MNASPQTETVMKFTFNEELYTTRLSEDIVSDYLEPKKQAPLFSK